MCVFLGVTDTQLSREEWQIFDNLQRSSEDYNPDAYACRLKLILVTADSALRCQWDVREQLEGYFERFEFLSAVCRLTTDEERVLLDMIPRKHMSVMLQNRTMFLQAIERGQTHYNALLPQRPTLEGEFDLVVDRSVMDEAAFKSTFLTTSYTRPIEGEGVVAIKALHEWISEGFRLKGGKNNLGFLFFFELLTGTLNIRVYSEDNTYQLACLLIRLLPLKDTALRKGVMQSIVKMLAFNPHTAQDTNFPKFQDTRTFKLSKMIQAGSSVFNTLLKNVRKYMTTSAANTVRWPTEPKVWTPPTTSTVPDAEALARDRRWLCPRIADYGCSKRTFAPADSAEVKGVEISTVDIKAFSGFPLFPIHLSSYCSAITRESRGLTAIDPVVPFDVSNHPYAKSHVAVQMIERLTEECALFAEQMNSGSIFKMTGLLDHDVQSYVEQPQQPRLGEVVSRIEKLQLALYDLRAKDLAYMLRAIDRLKVLANAVEMKPGMPAAAEANGDSDHADGDGGERKSDWEALRTDEGQVYFFNAKTNVTTWDKPDILKSAAEINAENALVWEELTAEDGKVYYFNAETGRSTWSKPVKKRVNGSASSKPGSKRQSLVADEKKTQIGFELGRYSGAEVDISFEYLVASLLSSQSDTDLVKLNPFLSPERIDLVWRLTVGIILHTNRIGQVNRALDEAKEMASMLTRMMGENARNDLATKQSLILKSSTLAAQLAMKRYYIRPDNPGQSPPVLSFDPRFLVFEFTENLMLRESQVELVEKFTSSYANRKSMVQQMIMGAGKTTVVGPLLALILGDGQHLVTQIVPQSLLEFSRGTMRSTFSSLIRKPVYTFSFDRFHRVTPDLYRKLIKARDTRAVVCTTPTAVKSFSLKFVEITHLLDQMKNIAAEEEKQGFSLKKFFGVGKEAKRRAQAAQDRRDFAMTLSQQAAECEKVLRLFKEGALILDEVDLILHPLKSELNWPLGRKEPLDFTKNKAGMGLRWEMPNHLLDAFFYATDGRMTVPFQESREALRILNEIKGKIEEGLVNKVMQRTPHLVLLNTTWYHAQLKPLLAQWMLLWLASKRLSGLKDEQITSYLLHRHKADEQALQTIHYTLSGDHIKMLNLTYDWLRSTLPFVLSKIDRVSFGLLNKDDLDKALAIDPMMPKSRRFMAVPFVGKDVPSPSSEFSHPDVKIGLTILAYRYEGLRRSDFMSILQVLHEDMEQELVPFHRRKACIKFAEWVMLTGARVRGWNREEEEEKAKKKEKLEMKRKDYEEKERVARGEVKEEKEPIDLLSFAPAPLPPSSPTNVGSSTPMGNGHLAGSLQTTDIWPLQLLEFNDEEQMNVVYDLLYKLPHISWYYLNDLQFPELMKHQRLKLSASGQALGGEMLFDTRLGFSGTPSDLIPVELGRCQYEKGSDGKMLHFLTSPEVMAYDILPTDWSVTSLLDRIALSVEPEYRALIDTGALITGLDNEAVARYLLEHGLLHCDGVVYLDASDRKMILVRSTMKSMLLSQCGIDKSRRFAFYDQVHTTGMDIKHAVNAMAVVTLGKDMTFRDYAQGTFRMRGIGQGQTIMLYIIPEVLKLIKTHLIAAQTGKQVEQLIYDMTISEANGGHAQAEDVKLEERTLLRHTCAWLVVNSMRSEKVQFQMLSEQSIENVWRKQAFNTLMAEWKTVGTDKMSVITGKSVDVFRDRVDYAVENAVPEPKPFLVKLQTMINEHRDFLVRPEEQEAVKVVLGWVASSQKKVEIKSDMQEQENRLMQEANEERAFGGEQVQEQGRETSLSSHLTRHSPHPTPQSLTCLLISVLCCFCRTRTGARTRAGAGAGAGTGAGASARRGGQEEVLAHGREAPLLDRVVAHQPPRGEEAAVLPRVRLCGVQVAQADAQAHRVPRQPAPLAQLLLPRLESQHAPPHQERHRGDGVVPQQGGGAHRDHRASDAPEEGQDPPADRRAGDAAAQGLRAVRRQQLAGPGRGGGEGGAALAERVRGGRAGAERRAEADQPAGEGRAVVRGRQAHDDVQHAQPQPDWSILGGAIAAGGGERARMDPPAALRTPAQGQNHCHRTAHR